MKALVLTQEQKGRLLEMCKDLFPKYKWEFVSDYESIVDETQVDALIQWKETGKYSQIFISVTHWFEFCIQHIAKEIYNKGNYYRNYVTFSHFVGWICTNAEHPLNNLYEEFKNLKVCENNPSKSHFSYYD